MQNPCGQPGQALQAGWTVEVADQGRDALGAQFAHPFNAGGERQQAHALTLAENARGPLADVTTPDAEHAVAAKACGQSAM